MTKDEELVAALSSDFTQASISEADRKMLCYVEKLTRSPASIKQTDVDLLTQAGFSHAAIFDVAQVAAYYAFVNRLASGLGVELET